MGYRRRTKSKYGTPRKGTKRRKLVLLLLRKQGLTTEQAYEIGMKREDLGGALAALRDDCGFDIQVIGTRPGRVGTRGFATKHLYVYRIIGRYRWSGSYRSFLRG